MICYNREKITGKDVMLYMDKEDLTEEVTLKQRSEGSKSKVMYYLLTGNFFCNVMSSTLMCRWQDQ